MKSHEAPKQLSRLLYACAAFQLFVMQSADRASAVPLPVHAFELQGSLEDSVSDGVGLVSEGGVVGSDRYDFNPIYPGDYSQGLTLVNTAITDPGVYSIEMRIKYDRLRNETPPGSYGPDQSWIKTIDYTDGLDSYGLYVEDNVRWEGPGEEGFIEFIASTGRPGGFHYPGVSPRSVIQADSWFHVVVTRDVAKVFTCYIDGVEVFDFIDAQDDAVVDAPSKTLRFFQPDEQAILQYNVYEVTKGAVDYIRVYDEALTAADAAALFTPLLPGDYNDDGKVDAADYTVWRDNEGLATALPNDPVGGVVGAEQYEAWRTHYGASSLASASTTVPEPTSVILCVAMTSVAFTAAARRSCSSGQWQ